MIIAGENRFFLSLRILLSFRTSGFFTFSSPLKHQKHSMYEESSLDQILFTDILGEEGEKRGENLKPIFGYSCTASSIWMLMNSWHVDTSAEHVNYQPVCRLETLAPYEVEGGSGMEGGGRAREREKRDTLIETKRQRQRHTQCQMAHNAKRTLLRNH